MSPHTLSLLLIFTLSGSCSCQYNCSFYELWKNLSFPDENVRPVKDWRTVSHMTIDLILFSVVQLDTSLQSLTTLIWFNLAWDNEFLVWDPDKFCSIKTIFAKGENLWKPDLYIYEMTESDDKSPVVPYFNITHNGKITNAKPLRIVSSCHLDIYRFPFDTQKCNISFGPYIHPVEDIIMSPRSNSAKVYKSSKEVFVSKGEWILLNVTVNSTFILSDNTNYSIVYYEITLKRVPDVYILTLIIPACLMILLDIVSMFIQMESGERLGFKITIVLGFSVLLLILNSILPTSNSAPMLGIFCLVCMTVMVISIIGCVVISYMLMLSEFQPSVPPWVKTVVLTYMANLLWFGPFNKYGIDIQTSTSKREANSIDKVDNTNNHIQDKSVRGSEDNLEVKLLKRLFLEMLKIRIELTDFKKKQDVKTEWHAAALVVDRFILIIYLIIAISLFAAVLIVWIT